MFNEKSHTNNIGNMPAIKHFMILVSENNQLVRNTKNPNREFIATIIKRIRKLRLPRVQQQFYIGPGVDWE